MKLLKKAGLTFISLFVVLFVYASGVPEQQAIATFAGGNFWYSEAVFEKLAGVNKVVTGFTGGNEKMPVNSDVVAGNTGHALAIQVYYNPQKISYQDLLKVYFATHDVTKENQQGTDIGKQYRSAIFYRVQKEHDIAENYIAELEKSGKYPDKIKTELTLFREFWNADGDNQDYVKFNATTPYVTESINPKLQLFEKDFKKMLK